MFQKFSMTRQKTLTKTHSDRKIHWLLHHLQWHFGRSSLVNLLHIKKNIVNFLLSMIFPCKLPYTLFCALTYKIHYSDILISQTVDIIIFQKLLCIFFIWNETEKSFNRSFILNVSETQLKLIHVNNSWICIGSTKIILSLISGFFWLSSFCEVENKFVANIRQQISYCAK